MKETKKMTGEARRKLILKLLKEAHQPITGSTFAEKANVSRQVIVQDISLLKAKNQPIIATSQGYLFITDKKEEEREQLVIACNHTPSETEKELYIIVDHGVTVKNIRIEHPVYGDLSASIMVSNRKEVDQFIEQITITNASYLAPLTEGTHLHTLEADSLKKIQNACNELRKAGILISE